MADSAWLWPTRYRRYFSKPSLFFRKHIATSSSVSHSFNLGRNALRKWHVKTINMTFLTCYYKDRCIPVMKVWAHLLWKDLISSMFLNMASLWLLTSGGASGLSACFRWWEVKKSTSLIKCDSVFIRSWISWLETKNNHVLLLCFVYHFGETKGSCSSP